MFDLIASILQPVFDLVPRVYKRPATTEWCVVDGWRSRPKVVSRPVVACPMFCHVEYYPRTPFPVDLEVQTLYAGDDELTINASLMVQIEDPIALRSSLGDEYVSCLSMVARSAIEQYVVENEEWPTSAELSDIIAQAVVSSSLSGATLKQFCIEDCAKTRSFRFYGSNIQF